MHIAIVRYLIAGHIGMTLLSLTLIILMLGPDDKAFFWSVAETYLWKIKTFSVTRTLAEWQNIDAIANFRRWFVPGSWRGCLTTPAFSIYLLWPVMVMLLHRKAKRLFTQRLKRGARLVTAKELKKMLIWNKNEMRISITKNFEIPGEYLARHFFISGATGTGKTTVISRMIESVKRSGGKAVVYDSKGGEFVSRFYSKHDLIVNPFDIRSVHWNFFDVFGDGTSVVTDFDSIAAAIIPERKTSDNYFFFVDTARQVLSAILKDLYVRGRQNVADLDDLFATKDMSAVVMDCLQRTEPKLRSFIDRPGGQTQGIMSVLSQHVQNIKFMVRLPDQQSLKVKEWLLDGQPGIIYLPHLENQRETLRGIISLFVEVLVSALLSLPDDHDRRIFFFLDEFGGLHKIGALVKSFQLIRSKGGILVLGIQEKSQLDERYGKYTAETMINNCNNRLIFRCNETNTATYWGKAFGEREQSVLKNSSSMSGDGDGSISYQSASSIEKIVLASEIQNMPDFRFYLKLHGLPVAPIATEFCDYERTTEGFIPQPHFATVNLSKLLAANGSPWTKTPGKEKNDGDGGFTEKINPPGIYPYDDFSL